MLTRHLAKWLASEQITVNAIAPGPFESERGEMRRTIAICAVLVVALASGSSANAATRIVYVAPVDAAGDQVEAVTVTRTVHGQCEPGSDSVPGPTYRCFFGNFIEDPCWADAAVAGSVLCMTQPWSTTAVRIYVDELEPSSDPVPTSLDYPWGVELTTGEKCVAFQGAHDQYRARVVDYGCDGAYLHAGRVLLRGMHRSSPLWSFDSAWWTGKRYQPRKRVEVRVAWYGGPSP
jgi:hypothetical protein